MKKKTVLSTLTLFFLLQSSPLRADNFFWNLFTSPVTPYALLVGFWSFVKVFGSLLPDNTKDIERVTGRLDQEQREETNRQLEVLYAQGVTINEQDTLISNEMANAYDKINTIEIRVVENSDSSMQRDHELRTLLQKNCEKLKRIFDEKFQKSHKQLDNFALNSNEFLKKTESDVIRLTEKVFSIKSTFPKKLKDICLLETNFDEKDAEKNTQSSIRFPAQMISYRKANDPRWDTSINI